MLLNFYKFENIADGIFSPLEGFFGQQDFENVISNGRLSNGLAWTIPIVLDVDESTATKMKEAGDVLLKNHQGLGVAVIHVDEIFSFDNIMKMEAWYKNMESSDEVTLGNNYQGFYQ